MVQGVLYSLLAISLMFYWVLKSMSVWTMENGKEMALVVRNIKIIS